MSRPAMADRPLSFCMVTTFYPPYHFGGEAMYIYRVSRTSWRSAATASRSSTASTRSGR